MFSDDPQLASFARDLQEAAASQPLPEVGAALAAVFEGRVQPPVPSFIPDVRPRPRSRRLRVVIGGAVFGLGVGSLGVAGALPGPVQRQVARMGDVVGVDLPDGETTTTTTSTTVDTTTTTTHRPTTATTSHRPATVPTTVEHDRGEDRGKDSKVDDRGEQGSERGADHPARADAQERESAKVDERSDAGDESGTDDRDSSRRTNATQLRTTVPVGHGHARQSDTGDPAVASDGSSD
jgi:hypothetical protein